MAKQITEYELLISCPTDVQEELVIINETVQTFNSLFGKLNNAKIVIKHWSKDSYPESGGKPQKLLNHQFVLGCDAAVAVFWTKFGTPTDEYDSGTEEEIEELLKSGKQVFLYFSDCPINPSNVDNEQYKKVKDFRERYKDRGLYWTYSNLDTFKKDFLNHLTLYFVNLMEGNKTQQEANYKSNLLVKGVDNGTLVDNAIAFQTKYSNCKHIRDIRREAISLIAQINEISLSVPVPSAEVSRIINDKEDEHEFPDITVGELEKLPKIDLSELSKRFTGLKNLYPVELAAIKDKCRERIDSFARENDIELNGDFYNLGTLSIQRNNYLAGVFGSSSSYNGTDEEKNKYKLISNLEDLLDDYDDSLRYFSAIDNLIFVCLALSNYGKEYDEDIDVKLYIKKGFICHPKDLPFPGFSCISIGIKSFEFIYKAQNNVNIDEYPDYYVKPYIPRVPSLPVGILGGKSHEELLGEKTTKFNDIRDKIFCYQYFSNDEFDILCYNQQYLKQNTNSFLPSYLVFKKIPDKISFEITAKRYPDVVKGELIIESKLL